MAGLEPFVPLDEALKRDHKLAPLLAQARLHERLLDKIRQTLAEPLGEHCLYCVLRGGGRLILYTDSAAWASKLRFYRSELKSALAELGPLGSIQIRVLLPAEAASWTNVGVTPCGCPNQGGHGGAPLLPSPQALDQLDRNATAIADPEIKQCLQRLVRTLRRAVHLTSQPRL